MKWMSVHIDQKLIYGRFFETNRVTKHRTQGDYSYCILFL